MSNPIKVKTLIVILKKTKSSTVKVLDAIFLLKERYTIPFYSFHLSSPKVLDLKKYTLKVGELTNGADLTVFYKLAQNKDLLTKEK